MRRLALSVALLASSGCYHIKYLNAPRPAAPANPEKWHHNFVFGFIEYRGTDLAQECPNGNWVSVEHEYSQLDAVLEVVGRVPLALIGDPLFAVWTPTHVRVTCGAKPSTAQPPPMPAHTDPPH